VTTYDPRQLTWYPRLPLCCSHCHQPFDDFDRLMFMSGGFHFRDGMMALLCDVCAKAMWQREREIEAQMEACGPDDFEAWYATLPTPQPEPPEPSPSAA
jgi:hypothetical protein